MPRTVTVRNVKNLFKRRAPLEDAVEDALREQVGFEKEHPIPFDADQRRARMLQSVLRRLPKANVVRAKELIHQALEAAQRR